VVIVPAAIWASMARSIPKAARTCSLAAIAGQGVLIRDGAELTIVEFPRVAIDPDAEGDGLQLRQILALRGDIRVDRPPVPER